MDASVLGIRLASGVVTPLVKKLFRGEGAGAGLVDRPVRISSYVSLREQRVLSREDLRRLADKLVAEALRAPGERPLPPGEETGVAAALAATLYALGDIALEDVQAVEMGPRAFAAELRRAAPATGLGRDAELFHDRLLELTCLHVLHFFTTRSTFVPASLVEQARRQAEAIDKIDALIARIPRQDARDTEFERRYLAYLVERQSTLTIFGLDLPPGSDRWPLDLAYVSLQAAAGPHHTGGTGPRGGNGATGPDHAFHGAPATAEETLARCERVLLRGEAGSGKTTLIQWLAVSTARDADPAGASGGRIPYVLPLRTLTRHGERLPAPEDFLAATALKGRPPEGWEDRVLRDGRGLVLVDGIDEIPEAERARARNWLADLIAAYPGNRWLVTSRPSAVRQGWLADDGFTELTLSPMNRTEVAGFVTRWHRAAEEPDDELRGQLLDSLRTKPDLARIATNPLLCGLICALHRERRGFLPSGRKELYAAALSMLLYRRDRERDLRLPFLEEEPQIQLLQRLAYWLIRNGRAEIGRARAEGLIAAALPAVPAAQALGDAQAVLRHFVERTGLLRAPTEDTVEFVHRTFQDFLGAGAALDEGGLGELTRHADDDQWEDVIRMAVAQGRPRDRAAIIGDLLVRGSDRSVLLALACLEYAAELEPELREEVRSTAGRLIPPPDLVVARILASCGPLVLDLLPGPAEAADDEAAFLTVVAAGGAGTDFAIPFLARFADHPSPKARHELVALWPAFDSRLYAEEVLARITPPPHELLAASDADLEALGACLPQVRGLRVVDGVSEVALKRYLSRALLHRLELFDVPLTDLDCLQGQHSLHSIQADRCYGLHDFDGLTGLPLETVDLALTGPTSVGSLTRSWPRLRSLTLSGWYGAWSLDDLAPGVSLTRLGLTEPPTSWSGLDRHPELTALSAHAGLDRDGWEALGHLEHLTHLVVSSLAEIPDKLCLPTVRFLKTDRPGDGRPLVRHFPNLV